MIGMGMIEADDVLFALAAFALYAHQLLGIDVVAVLRRIRARISRARHRGHEPRAVIIHAAEQYSTALMRIRLFAMVAKRVVMRLTKRSEERRVGKECRSRWSP